MAIVTTNKRWRAACAALLMVGAVAGCDSGPSGGDQSGRAPQGVATTAAVSTPSGRPDLDAGEEMARGIDVPWGLAFLPNGDALVGERNTGRVLRLSPGGGDPRQVYEVPGVVAGGEGGLLGLAVSPRFADDNLIYAYFTAEQDNRIVRFRLDGGHPEVIFDGIAKASYHNGGRIAFGTDGMLYIGTGDAGDTQRSQDPASPNGKTLRLTPEGSPAPGNPSPRSPVYSLGHRNVQGLAWDSAGRLFATEFGQNELDEVNHIEPGRNTAGPGRRNRRHGRWAVHQPTHHLARP